MKKLFNGRFLFILISSLLVLIFLGVGAYFLFDDSDATFVKSGYVLNPLSANKEKYYFDKDVSYKENLSGMVEFNDKDNKEVNILRDSFLHYEDGSMSFLKNGAILDLDSINGDNPVIFYNISNKSIIDRSDEGFAIRNTGNDIKLKDFIGRINDNKYIVAGNLNLKIQGNDQNIKGNYFEIVYVEEGIINIENDENKYQVAADGTYIYLNNLVIDFGDKKISSNDKDIMSLTAITIDGNENIEIIPLSEEKGEENNQNGTGSGNGNGTGTGTGNGTGGGNGNGTGSGNGGNSQEIINTTDIIVSLKDATVSNVEITTVFDIYNAKNDDSFILHVVNLNTSKEIEIIDNEVFSEKEMYVGFLTPKTRYLFTVVNEKDDNKYFQKIFETSEFGVKLEKTYVTDSELGYAVTFAKGTNIKSAKLRLEAFNEETKKNEVVTTTYMKDGVEVIKEQIYIIENDKIDEDNVIPFKFVGLNSNTIYTAILSDIVIENGNFKDKYELVLNTLTLKKTPDFTMSKEVKNSSFKLFLEDVSDPDNAITKYTYNIYQEDDLLNTVIAPIVKTNASPIEINVGDAENELHSGEVYVYKTIVEYYDNEKYVRYTKSDTVDFTMGIDPKIQVILNDAATTYNTVKFSVELIDNSCAVPMEGRTKCSQINDIKVMLTEVDDGNPNGIVDKKELPIVFPLDEENNMEPLPTTVTIGGLKEGTTYKVEVWANVEDKDGKITYQTIKHTDDSKKNVRTKYLSDFQVNWEDYKYKEDHIINVGAKLEGIIDPLTTDPDISANALSKVVLRLYKGDNIINPSEDDALSSPATFYNTSEFNIKEKFYDNIFSITSDEIFGLTLDDFKNIYSEEGINEYTLTLEAYYENNNPVRVEKNAFPVEVPKSILEEIDDPTFEYSKIINCMEYDSNTKKCVSKYDDNLQDDTVIGYNVRGIIDPKTLIDYAYAKINYYVFDINGYKVSFKNENGELVPGLTYDYGDDAKVYLDYGLPYGEDDKVMRRGNKYYLGYEIEFYDENDTLKEVYPENKNSNVHSENNRGYYPEEGFISAPKDSLTVASAVKSYISKTTENSVTYYYSIKDIDNALYKEGNGYNLYYRVNDSEEEHKLSIDGSEGNYSGSVVLTGLVQGDTYVFYYKDASLNTNDVTADISPIYFRYENEDSEKRLFEGKYSVIDSKYDLKYEIINNEGVDNKVIIRFIASDMSVLDRIVNYNVKFSSLLYEKDNNGNYTSSTFLAVKEFNFDGSLLGSCSELGITDVMYDKSCLSVEYKSLKEKNNWNMRSDEEKSNEITVEIKVYYDNGISGYDYISKEDITSDRNYSEYMILQRPSINQKFDNYVAYTNLNGMPIFWSKDTNAPIGYYKSNLAFKGTSISYQRLLEPNDKYNKKITVTLKEGGYYSSSLNGIVNPKMVSSDDISAKDGKNTFSFGSIIPTVKVTEKARLINGAVEKLDLVGVDFDDSNFKNEGTKKNPIYYLYVETWESEEDVGNLDKVSRKKIPVQINGSSATVRIEDLKHDGWISYFRVYAELYDSNENEYRYRPLFADGEVNVINTTSIKTLTREEVYTSKSHSIVLDEEIYGKRYLKSIFSLNAKNEINYDLIYVFCEDSSCDYEKNYLYKENISRNNLPNTSGFKLSLDKKDIVNYLKNNNMENYFEPEYYSNFISKYGENLEEFEIEYNKSYVIKLYAVSNKNKGYAYSFDSSLQYLELTDSFDQYWVLTPLNELYDKPETNNIIEEIPIFSSVDRMAGVIDNNNYYIDLTVHINDPYQMIVGKSQDGFNVNQSDKGKIFIKLYDTDGIVQGTLQVKNADKEWVDAVYDGDDYSSYAIDVSNLVSGTPVNLRIANLNKNTNYGFEIYTNVYKNNADVLKGKRTFKISYKVPSVYTSYNSGVAFGDVSLSAIKSGYVLYFSGGSNLKENIEKIGYTVINRDTNKIIADGKINISSSNNFESVLVDNIIKWKMVIPGVEDNVEGTKYGIIAKLYYKDQDIPVTFELDDIYTSEDDKENSN